MRTGQKGLNRLAPLVAMGYRLYRGQIAGAGSPEAADRATRNGSTGFRRVVVDHLRKLVSSGKLKHSTLTDCEGAADILDSLLFWAVHIESGMGNGDDAVAELARRVPGLHPRIYPDVIGYFGYINR